MCVWKSLLPVLKPSVAQVNGMLSSAHAQWLSLSLHREEFRGPVSIVHSRPQGPTQTHTHGETHANTFTHAQRHWEIHAAAYVHCTHTVGPWLQCSNRRDIEIQW